MPVNCTETIAMLDLLLDDMLDPKESLPVLAHIRDCHSCAGEWHSLEQLRAAFGEAKAIKLDTTKLMCRVSRRIKDDGAGQRRLSPLSQNLLLVAVLLAIVGLFATNTRAPHSAVKLSALIANNQYRIVQDRSMLASQLGYSLKFVHPPGWHVSRSSILSQEQEPIARFDFTKDGGSEDYLICYQARAGTFGKLSQDSVDLGGKEVQIGELNGKRFALWSKDCRDYLFVTSLPAAALLDIVSRS